MYIYIYTSMCDEQETAKSVDVGGRGAHVYVRTYLCMYVCIHAFMRISKQ